MKKLLLLATFLLFSSPAWAIYVSSLTSSSSTTDATSYATSSITPSANCLVLATVQSRIGSGTPPNTPTATGNGLTWVTVNSVVPSNANNRKVTVLRAMGSSPSSGAVTFDFNGQTQTHAVWSIAQFCGVDTSGTNGSGAIVQSSTAESSATGTTATVTLSSISDSSNATYGASVHFINNDTVPGSGYTEIHDITVAENLTGFGTFWQVGTDNTVDSTWATSSHWGIVGLEIKTSSTTLDASTIDGATIQ